MSRFYFLSRLARLGWLAGVIGWVSLLTAPAGAQTAGSAQDRADLLRTRIGLREDPTSEATGSDSVHAIASPNDADLGEQAILKRAEEYQPFSIFAALPLSFTSNAALARRGEQSDTLLTPLVGASYAPRLTKTLFLNVSVAQQSFYYYCLRDLDFASLDVRVGLVYFIPRWHNLVLRADYDYNRLSSVDWEDEIFVNHSINLGAELPFRIGRAQQVSVGTDLSFSVDGCPDPPARHDFSTYVAYSADLSRDVTLNAAVRLAVRDYVNSSRTDVAGIFALGANYRLGKLAMLSATATFATNNSNQDVFSYDVLNIGGGLAVNVRF